jgi:hypothetical protein
VENATAVDVAYVITPFTGWFIAGSLKFAINCLRSGRLVWDQIGLGGLPSNHTAVVSSTAVLIGLRDGVNTALFAIALTLAIIVILDALHLRREVGAHAAPLARASRPSAGGSADGFPRWFRLCVAVARRLPITQ